MARVLFLTQVLPYPLNAGPKVRQYYMLRHLAGRHAITLVSFVRPDDTPEAVAHLRQICRAVHTIPIRRSLRQNLQAGVRSLVSGRPLTMARDESAALAQVLRELAAAQDFDLVHADQLYMAGHGLYAARRAPRRPASVLDEHNAVYVLTQRLAAGEARRARRAFWGWEARALARYEAQMGRAFDALLTVSEEDRAQLLALYGAGERAGLAGKFSVVPICVDPEQVAPVLRRPRLPGEPPAILHLGTMFWPPNVEGVLWFAREVLPLVWRRAPEARFVVIGKAPPPEVQALAADPRIEVTGYVDDPRPYIEAADAFVVPLHAGGGMRVKILDAWQWGLPLVSTPLGAEGIAVRDGENILLAENAEDFAAATLRLLEDEGLNQQLRLAGRAWVEATYAWQVVYRKVDEVYERVLGVGG